MNVYKPYSVPVSVKGIVFEDGKVWLRKNERNEWELPGGKMDEGEQPEETVARELAEELGFTVSVKNLISAHLAVIAVSTDENRGVFVVSYVCELLSGTGNFEHQGEAGVAEFQRFSFDELPALRMPQFYKDAIVKASRQLK
jgi:8-oxo-dGTP pyrophosphatase MutT (NUDIX family)